MSRSQANSKSLIAYYSRKGNNYLGGQIVDLPVGNTEVIAKKIQGLTGSDIFKINTVKTYPEDYTETTNVAQKEKTNNARPELTEKVSNMDTYDVIILGYPNWWGTMPMALFTFLESHDFSGKTIVPFCTNEGSGMGSSERDIRKICPGAKVLPGLSIRGGEVAGADKEVANWLKKNELIH
jgi:flavodoxin